MSLTCEWKQCGRSFTDLPHLVTHLQSHLSELRDLDLPLICHWNKCTRPNVRHFKKPYQLQRHLRIHTAETPFHCTLCPKQFSTKEHFQRHQSVHTGDCNYKCSVCGKSYARTSERFKCLQKHANVQYTCPICPRTYKDSAALRKHIRYYSHYAPPPPPEIHSASAPTFIRKPTKNTSKDVKAHSTSKAKKKLKSQPSSNNKENRKCNSKISKNKNKSKETIKTIDFDSAAKSKDEFSQRQKENRDSVQMLQDASQPAYLLYCQTGDSLNFGQQMPLIWVPNEQSTKCDKTDSINDFSASSQNQSNPEDLSPFKTVQEPCSEQAFLLFCQSVDSSKPQTTDWFVNEGVPEDLSNDKIIDMSDHSLNTSSDCHDYILDDTQQAFSMFLQGDHTLFSRDTDPTGPINLTTAPVNLTVHKPSHLHPGRNDSDRLPPISTFSQLLYAGGAVVPHFHPESYFNEECMDFHLSKDGALDLTGVAEEIVSLTGSPLIGQYLSSNRCGAIDLSSGAGLDTVMWGSNGMSECHTDSWLPEPGFSFTDLLNSADPLDLSLPVGPQYHGHSILDLT